MQKQKIYPIFFIYITSTNLVKKKACFINSYKPFRFNYMDLVLMNCSCSLQNTNAFKTRLSDFHKITATVKKIFIKGKQNLAIL